MSSEDMNSVILKAVLGCSFLVQFCIRSQFYDRAISPTVFLAGKIRNGAMQFRFGFGSDKTGLDGETLLGDAHLRFAKGS